MAPWLRRIITTVIIKLVRSDRELVFKQGLKNEQWTSVSETLGQFFFLIAFKIVLGRVIINRSMNLGNRPDILLMNRSCLISYLHRCLT